MKRNFSPKTLWLFLAGLMVVSLIASGVAIGSAQAPKMSILENPPKVWITAGEPSEVVVRNRPPAEFLRNAPQTANITVTYVGTWDASAQAAFEYAVSIWETQITSSVEIQVEAEWDNLGPGILGGAGAEDIVRDFPGAPVAGTWYPVALANKISGSDQMPGAVDIGAAFNSAFSSWYFGTDGNPPGDQYDFVSVVLHEIGHGLGFFGSMSVGSNCGGAGIGCWGYGSGYPTIYDRFTENGAGTSLLSFPNFSSELAAQLTSNNIFFDGPNANAANGNARVPLYAPGTWQQGSSYSHLAESFNGTVNALMTYSIGPGDSEHAPGPVMLGMFTDMGWGITTPTPTPTKTSTPTQIPTCTPFPTVTPVPTLEGATNVYLPLANKAITNCLPNSGGGGPTATPTPTATSTGGYFDIYYDNFEGTFPGPWQLASTGSTPGFEWGQSNCQAQNSTFSAWGIGGGSSGQGYPCASNYPNNVETWMTYGPFSTAGLTASYMTFGTWFYTEQSYDFICYLASAVGGTDPTDYEGWCWSGDSQSVTGNVAGWIQEFLNLGDIYGDGTVNFLGDSSVWVSFYFYSDEIFTYPTGAFVDNAWIRGCITNCTLDANGIQPLDGVQKLPWKEFQTLKESFR